MKNARDDKKTVFDKKLLCISFFTSLILILICSKCSPLYAINDWSDVAALFIGGKRMLKGEVLYRDFYEHKGLYYVALHALGALISKKSYIGMFILEIPAHTIFLYFVGKIWKLYLDDGAIKYIPLFDALVVGSMIFCQGDSCEEFCLPLFAYSTLKLVSYIKEKEDKSFRGNIPFWFIQGILTGVVFWIKYTLCSFYVGICICLLAIFLKRKNIKGLIKVACIWAVGMIIASIPAFIYFGVNNAFKDLWHVYGYNLIFAYKPNKPGISYVLLFIVLSIFVCLLFIIGGAITKMTDLVDKDSGKMLKILFVCQVAYILLLAWKEKYALLVLANIFAIWFMGYIYILDNILKEKVKNSMIFVGVCIVSLIAASVTNINKAWIGKDKDTYIYYEYAKIINEEDNPTLFVYKGMEEGFYFAADIMPTYKYITDYNIRVPEIEDEKDRMIKDREPMFVITIESEPDIVKENYDLVKKEKFNNNADIKDYYLWKVKE